MPVGAVGDAVARRHRREHRRHGAQLRRHHGSSRRCCRRASRTCSSTARRASPSGWRRTSRRTTSARSSTPPMHLIDNPEATPDDLMQFVKGPDFPTGASILGRAGIMDAYRTGRGSIKLRATAAIEESKKGAMQIVVTELPYQTSCSSIAARIQELVDGGDLDGIADVNDESAEGKTQLVVTLKRDANANVVLNNLFKLTQLQTSFAVNVVALVKGVPRTLNLAQVLQGYVDHQVDVVTRRSEFRLQRRPGARAHPRRADQGARRDRRDHRPDPRQRGRQRRQGRADGRAIRVLRDPGDRHPRHAAAPSHPAVAHRHRDRAGRDSLGDPRAAGDPRRPGPAAHRDQDRAVGRSARSSPRRVFVRSRSTPARCRSRTSSTTRSSSS